MTVHAVGRSTPAVRHIGRSTLVAPGLKVLYTPTTKVACTTIKWMLAEAEGSLRTDVIPRLLAANLHRSQTIHNRHVSGLQKLNELPPHQVEEILESPEWIRLAALRDPVARSYSAWENRIFMRAPGRTDGGFELAPDVLRDGCIDMTASFARFSEALEQQPQAFMRDHHFVPQSQVVRTDAVRYDLLVRVDEPGGVDSIAAVFRERSGKDIQPQRHNESIGVPLDRACDATTAARLMSVYQSDYDAFGFERRTFAASVEPYVLSASETQLVTLVRQSVERVTSVSRAAQSKMSARFGVRQIRKAFLRRITFGRMYNTPRGIHW
ncbi:MAG: sulfotransferase family 2 domain-containing protein [Ilumatobacteraceae bacterium]